VTENCKVTAAGRKDFGSVTFVCPACEAATSVQIETASLPLNCRSCGTPLDEKAQSALSALAQFHRHARAAEEKAGKPLFRFELKEEESA
jgi:transcription elongation factor Elf1